MKHAQHPTDTCWTGLRPVDKIEQRFSFGETGVFVFVVFVHKSVFIKNYSFQLNQVRHMFFNASVEKALPILRFAQRYIPAPQCLR